jgi:hypothetical protein
VVGITTIIAPAAILVKGFVRSFLVIHPRCYCFCGIGEEQKILIKFNAQPDEESLFLRTQNSRLHPLGSGLLPEKKTRIARFFGAFCPC